MNSKNAGRLSRRQFLITMGAVTASSLLVACAPAGPAAAPAAEAPAAAAPAAEAPAAAAPAAERVTVRAHMVEKQDVSAWIQMGLDQDIDGFKAANPNVDLVLETIPGWTAEYTPKILSFTAAGTLGDLVWYPPRHRSHIAWGESYGVVQDYRPYADSAGYKLEDNFFQGAIDVNSAGGKAYWMSYISEPIVPIIAYNKTKVAEMGLAEPTDDWTFDELAEWAQKGTTADVFGYYAADRAFAAFSGGPYYRQHGVEPVNAEGTQATFLDTQESFVKALKFDYDLINTWKVSPSPSAGAVNAPELFSGQKVLAVDIWPFRIQIYPATFTDFEIGFVLTPVVNKGDKRRSMLNEHVFGLTSASKNPDAAFASMAWFCGYEMNVQALVQGQKGPIARADVWADQRIYDSVPTYAKLRPIMEAIEPDYLVANYRGEEFDQAFAQVEQAMQLGEKQPEEAAIEIQALCQAVLDKEAA